MDSCSQTVDDTPGYMHALFTNANTDACHVDKYTYCNLVLFLLYVEHAQCAPDCCSIMYILFLGTYTGAVFLGNVYLLITHEKTPIVGCSYVE